MPGQPQDRQRSVPFARFMELAGDPELLVFSLQGGVHQKDIQQFGAGGLVHDVGRGIFDFAEAATALSQLDLLMSIDAPIAHLAAAMGVKTWVLLPSTVDWRWQLGGTRAPWYPSARLFRQPRPGDWDSGVRRRCDASSSMLKQSARRSDLRCCRSCASSTSSSVSAMPVEMPCRNRRQRVGKRMCRRPSHTRRTASAAMASVAARTDQPEAAVARRPEHQIVLSQQAKGACDVARPHRRNVAADQHHAGPRGSSRNGRFMRRPRSPAPWSPSRSRIDAAPRRMAEGAWSGVMNSQTVQRRSLDSRADLVRPSVWR